MYNLVSDFFEKDDKYVYKTVFFFGTQYPFVFNWAGTEY